MINKNLPLPDSLRKYYDEFYAMIVLEHVNPDEFLKLEKMEQPDLQSSDGKWGIEVTIAIDKDKIESENVYSKLSYDLVRNNSKAEQKIKKCGCTLKNGILIGKPSTSSFDLIINSFNKKLDLLNGNKYKDFKYNCLFVFSYIHASDIMISNAIQQMQQLQINFNKKFHEIFVLVPGYFYVLNLSSGSFKVHRIDSKTQSLQAIKARNLTINYAEMYMDM